MASNYISSLHNPLLREYKKLLASSVYRHKLKKIALEGPNLLREALKAGLTPEVVFYTEEYYDKYGQEWLSAFPGNISKIVLSDKAFKSIADTDTPQGVAAILPFKNEVINKPSVETQRLILILDRVQDPGNMGTIIRTAAAVDADHIYYTKGSVDPYSPKVLRSTAGAIFDIRLEPIHDYGLFITDLQERGIKLVAACAKSKLQYWSADLRGPVALIIGNEAGGIKPELESAADLKISIPLSGSVGSLNASVAAGVILFEIIRQRAAYSP